MSALINFRARTALFAILICLSGTILCAQTDQQEQQLKEAQVALERARLGAALVAEESQPDPSKALDLFRLVAGSKHAESEVRFDALRGEARCLLRLNRGDELEQVLERLSKLAGTDTNRAVKVQELRAQYRKLISQQIEISEEDLERASIAIQQNKFRLLEYLGDKAVPALMTLVRKKRLAKSQPSLLKYLQRRRDVSGFAALTELWKGMEQFQRVDTVGQLTNQIQPSPVSDAFVRLVMASPITELQTKLPRWVRSLSNPSLKDLEPFLRSEDPAVRQAAYQNLRTEFLTNEEMIGIGKRAMKDSFAGIRAWALEGSSFFERAHRQEPRLLEAAVSDKSSAVRRSALVYAGRKMSIENGRPFLLAAINDPDPGVQSMALQTLQGRMRSQDVPLLRPLLGAPSAQTRGLVIRLLSQYSAQVLIESPEREVFFTRLARSNDRETRQFAASVLARGGSDNLDDLMTEFFAGSDFKLKAAAFYYAIRYDKIHFLPQILPDLNFYSNASLTYVSADFQRPPSIRGRSQDRIFHWLRMKGHTEELFSVLKEAKALQQNSTSVINAMESAIEALVPDARKKEAFALLAQGIKPEGYLIFESLGDFFGSEDYAVNHYLKCLVDPAVRQKTSYAKLVHEHAQAKHVTRLIQTLGSGQRAQDLVIETVGRLGSADTVATLKATLESEPADAHKVHLIKALGATPRSDAAEALLAGLSDRRFGTREQRVAAMLSVAQVIPQLEPKEREALLEKTVSVLMSTIRKYEDQVERGQWGSIHHYSLYSSVNDPYRPRRLTAGVMALHQVDPEGYMERAGRELQEGDWPSQVRVDFLHFCAFGDRDDDLDAELIKHLSDKDAAVRRRAIYVAAHTLTQGMLWRISELLRDPEVAGSANHALRRFAEFGYRPK